MKNYSLIALILLFSNCGVHHHRYDVSYTDYKYILLLTKADNKEDTLHFVADNALIDEHWCIQLWDLDAGTPTNLSKSLNPTGRAYSPDDHSPLAIYAYDRRAKITSQISPKGYSCFQPSIHGDRIFFSGRKQEDPLKSRNDPVFNIYSMDMTGGDFRVEYKGRRDYSQRRE